MFGRESALDIERSLRERSGGGGDCQRGFRLAFGFGEADLNAREDEVPVLAATRAVAVQVDVRQSLEANAGDLLQIAGGELHVVNVLPGITLGDEDRVI